MTQPTPRDPRETTPPPSARPESADARQQLTELVRRQPSGLLSLWLLYEEDHYETISGDGFGLLLDFASPLRDEVHEIARARLAATDWYVFHLYRVDLRIGPAGNLERHVELDATVPGEDGYEHDVGLTVEELVQALGRPRRVESGSAWRNAARAEPRPAPGPGLGRPFETPVGAVEGALAMIARDLDYVTRELGRAFPGSPAAVALASEACEAWRAAIATHGRPAAERLRERLAAGEDPAPALLDFAALEAAAQTFHERLTALRARARGEESTEELERLVVLLSESGAHYLRAWLRIERERAEIARLWSERRGPAPGSTTPC